MTTLQTHVEQARTGGATAKSITLPSGPTLQVGDDMYLQFVAGGDYDGASTGATPAGWSIVENELYAVNVSVHQTVFHRVCQSGDPGSVVTVPDTIAALGKTVLNLVVVRSVNSSGPIQDSSKSHETASSATHATPVATVGNAGKVLQFIGLKDATASTTMTLPGTYSVIARTTTGGGTAPIVGVTAISAADIAPPNAASVNWTSDQVSANASMISIAIDPLSTVVGVRTSSDITLPSGATFGGGATTLFGAHGDDDPNTYARFVLSGTAQVEEEKFPTLPGPLTGYTGKLSLDGAVTVSVVVRLMMGATVLFTSSAFVITAAGEQNFHVDFDAGVQAAQTNLADIRIRKSYTGS